MRRMLFVLAALLIAGCSSSPGGPAVPSLTGGSNSAATSGSAKHQPAHGYSTRRVAQLRAAAQCVRTHGAPTYQDPVLTPDGNVYTDARSIESLDEATTQAIEQACGPLLAAAGIEPADESPAPPALVQAGARAARCLRPNGMPNYRDPTSTTPFTPGHGFGISADELPYHGALGKTDPAVQRAFAACRPLLDAEIRASSLGTLSHG